METVMSKEAVAVLSPGSGNVAFLDQICWEGQTVYNPTFAEIVCPA
jgi:hypothetical protein